MNNPEDKQNLEDNLPMVSYIMLHRIYDMLTLIADMLSKNEDDRQRVVKMVEYHKEGFLLGPAPSYNSGENND